MIFGDLADSFSLNQNRQRRGLAFPNVLYNHGQYWHLQYVVEKLHFTHHLKPRYGSFFHVSCALTSHSEISLPSSSPIRTRCFRCSSARLRSRGLVSRHECTDLALPYFDQAVVCATVRGCVCRVHDRGAQCGC